MKSEIKTDLLKRLILNLHFESGEIPNIHYFSNNKLIRDINSFQLRKELEHGWMDYLGKSVDLIEFQEEFGDKYRDWQVQMIELEKIKTKTEMTEFVKNYFGNDIQLGYNLGDISDKEIKELIRYKEPKISTNFQGKVNGIYNFAILTRNQLHLTVHLKFNSFKENSFLVTVIFSFWFEKPTDLFSLGMDYINNWYFCHVLGRKLMSKLEIRNYKKLDLFELESFDVKYIKKNENRNQWSNNYPEMIITYVKKLLNANPVKIIEEIIGDLKDIKEEEITYEFKNFEDPHSWFENLSEELKHFYNKGKEIFLSTTRLLDADSSFEERRLQKEMPKESREKLSLENLIFLFNKAMEVDLNNKIPGPEAGFRTQKSLFDEFLNKKTRDKKYDFIEPVSRGTFYSTIKKYRNELNSILERDSSRGQGGGDAFRIIKPKTIHEMSQYMVSDDDLEVYFVEIKEKIHEGLVYYDEKNYNDAIRVFEEILSSKNRNFLTMKSDYFGSLYSLGKLYMKIGLFEKAKEQFETIFTLDSNKLDSRFRLLICLYNLGKYEKADEIARNLFKHLNNILIPYSSLYEIYKEILYREDLSIFYPEPEKIHPNLFKRDLFNNYLIMMNRYYTKIDLFHLRPKYGSDWEDYQKKLSEFEDKKYYIGINVTAYRKLKLIQLNVEKYILEIYRKLITRTLIFQEKDNNFFSVVDEILNLLYNYVIEVSLKSESLNNFLLYNINLSQLYYKMEKNIISDSILQKFGNLDNKLKIGGFPEQTRFYNHFLYIATSALNTNNYDWAQKDLHKNLNKPDLELELFCLELFNLKEIELPKLEKETQECLSNFASREYSEVTQIFDDWKYKISLPEYSGN